MNEHADTPEKSLCVFWKKYSHKPLAQVWHPLGSALNSYIALRIWPVMAVVCFFLLVHWAVVYLRSDRDTTSYQIIATLIAVLGAVGLAINAIYTYKRARAVEEQVEVTREQIQRETGHRTKELNSVRFKNAVDQLGDTEHMHIRLGGIYSLSALARDDAQGYYQTVFEILSAFVRSYRRPEPEEVNEAGEKEETPLFKPPEDILAALTEIGRRDVEFEKTLEPDYRPDLSHVDFQRWNLRGVKIPEVDLTKVNLPGADLRFANLPGAYLKGANLTGANLKGADLTFANLTGANLTEAYLRGADLTGANLQHVRKGMTLDQFKDAIIDGTTIPPEYLRDEWDAWRDEVNTAQAAAEQEEAGEADDDAAQPGTVNAEDIEPPPPGNTNDDVDTETQSPQGP